MRLTLFVLVGLFVGLQYKLWFGPGSVVDVFSLKQKVDMQVAKNIELREKNARLAAEVADLKDGSDALQERARNDLGMVKRGEEFYQFVKPRSGSNAGTTPEADAT